jgi:hypothetical protein
MEALEVIIKDEAFKIVPNKTDNSFSVFNHATCHTIKKTDIGVWKTLVHRFGKDNIPLPEIGDAIEKYYIPPFSQPAIL